MHILLENRAIAEYFTDPDPDLYSSKLKVGSGSVSNYRDLLVGIPDILGIQGGSRYFASIILALNGLCHEIFYLNLLFSLGHSL